MLTKNWLITIALSAGTALSSHALAAGAASAGMSGAPSAGMNGARAGTAIPVGNLGANGAPAAPVITGQSPPTISGATPPTISGTTPNTGAPGTAVQGTQPSISGTIPGVSVNGAPVYQNGVASPNGTVSNPGVPVNSGATETPSSF